MNSQDNLLSHINDAADVRKLPREELPKLCEQVRECLIDTVSRTSGHLASGLGVVELTVALHYVFNTPEDKLVWDVGHQAYPHKILTGHRDQFATIRQKDGLHAFIWRGETPYDLISTGHASTSIGSALGLAVAESKKPKNERRKVIAIIGDGAMSGGCAFEALNHAGSLKDLDLLVILNDNEMSISQNVGSLAQGLAHVISSPHYVKMIEGGKRILKGLPAVKDFAMRAQEHVKGMLMPGTLFEEFGFNYVGPVDGNDINRLVTILQNIREMSGLNFLHIMTKKGKGYAPAEQDPICYHGVPTFNPLEGILASDNKEDKSYSAAFGRWMCDKAQSDKKLMAVTPAMRIGGGLEEFSQKYPEQFFDVAIAEQHAMVFASGLAAGGLRPVVNIYSTFLQRAYDGLIHDMAVQDLPIILTVDRGGIVGPDGPTHNGAFDIAYTRAIPNLVIMAPASRHELYAMLNTAYDYAHPCVIRYPRSNGESLLTDEKREKCCLSLQDTLTIGKVETIHLSLDLADYVEGNDDLRELFNLDETITSLPQIMAKEAIAHVGKFLEQEVSKRSANFSEEQLQELEEYKYVLTSKRIVILCYGPVVHELAPAAIACDITLINMRFIKPVDEELIITLSDKCDLMVTIEEGARLGGIGEHISSIVAQQISPHNKLCCMLNIGLADHFIMEATRNEALVEEHLDAISILKTIAQECYKLDVLGY